MLRSSISNGADTLARMQAVAVVLAVALVVAVAAGTGAPVRGRWRGSAGRGDRPAGPGGTVPQERAVRGAGARARRCSSRRSTPGAGVRRRRPPGARQRGRPASRPRADRATPPPASWPRRSRRCSPAGRRAPPSVTVYEPERRRFEAHAAALPRRADGAGCVAVLADDQRPGRLPRCAAAVLGRRLARAANAAGADPGAGRHAGAAAGRGRARRDDRSDARRDRRDARADRGHDAAGAAGESTS